MVTFGRKESVSDGHPGQQEREKLLQSKSWQRWLLHPGPEEFPACQANPKWRQYLLPYMDGRTSRQHRGGGGGGEKEEEEKGFR